MKVNHSHDLKGERKDQLLVVTDKDGKPKGLATREECHRGKGKTHLAFMAFILDKDANVVLAKRSSNKSLWGGFWDATVVSHILPGETPEVAANRRGKEEMGANLEFKSIGAFYYFARHGRSSENEYCYCLVGKTKGKLHPNPVEISDTKIISVSQLKEDLRLNPDSYTPWLKIALDKFNL